MKSVMGSVIQIDDNNYIGNIRNILELINDFAQEELDLFFVNEGFKNGDNYHIAWAEMLIEYMETLNTWAHDEKLDIDKTYIAIDISDTRGYLRKEIIDWRGDDEE